MSNEESRLVASINASVESIKSIASKDADFHQAISDTLVHLAKTYEDKYANSPLPTKGILYHDEHGQGYNLGNAAKYISRYLTKGFSKSENPEDLKKAIHYCLFELTRKIKQKNKVS